MGDDTIRIQRALVVLITILFVLKAVGIELDEWYLCSPILVIGGTIVLLAIGHFVRHLAHLVRKQRRN